MNISDFLQPGAENATPARELCRLTGLNERTLRHRIAEERAAGGEILFQPSGHGGYFRPSLDAAQAQRERAAFYNAMRARALSTFEGLRPVAQALGRPLGQLTIDEFLDVNDEPKKEES